ncbi:MAG: DsbA family protein [Coxiellaceae bacterium]|nr:MAG: DsbA family protein [Coxiellaceae bacterium]
MFAADSTAPTVPAATAQANNFSTTQTKQIEDIVHSYLVKNPQVLVEAANSLQQQQMSQMEKTASKAIAKNAKDIFNSPGSPVMGNPQGDVTLVEFMDYQCGHCKDMGPVLDALIKSDGQLRVVIKEFPIFGPDSEFASRAALASQKQGKFTAFHLALLADRNRLNKDEVLKVAQKVGIDTQKLQQDMNDPAIDAQLKENVRLAQELGLIGTPAIVIGNKSGSKTAFIPGTASKDNLIQVIKQTRS